MQEFQLEDSEYIELNKLLKVTGLCNSGGQASAFITDGQVKVDGNVETRKRCKIRSGQLVEVMGHEVTVK